MFQVGQKIKTCADLYCENQIINKISQIIAIEIFLSCIRHNFGLFKNHFETSSSHWCLCFCICDKTAVVRHICSDAITPHPLAVHRGHFKLIKVARLLIKRDDYNPRPIERRLDWVFYKTKMKI